MVSLCLLNIEDKFGFWKCNQWLSLFVVTLRNQISVKNGQEVGNLLNLFAIIICLGAVSHTCPNK